jgi:ferredoxin-NADP reductase
LTAPLLLAYIFAALLLQLAVGIGVAVWRRRSAAAAAPAAATDAAEAPHVSSAAWPGWRELRIARREFEDAAHTQCSFYLEPIDGRPLPEFRPGQFLTFSLQVDGAGDDAQGGARAITRCYSLSDRPDPKRYRITIKRVLAPADRPDLPPGASSNHFHDRVHEGNVLKVKAPSGHFFIDPDPAIPAVLIAGGIGITPLLSMLRWCVAEQPGRTVHLYYGLRHSAEHAFKQLLEELAGSNPHFHLNVVYSRPGPNDEQGRDFQHSGHVDVDLLRRTLPHGRHQFYVCGPAPMMESLVPVLARWGVPEQDIHYEAFGPASVPSAQGAPKDLGPGLAAPVEVRFRRSGRTLMWDGQDETLLEFAERHGVAVDSGCRSGGCGTCETKLISGTVRYPREPDHDVARGHCLLCVGRPESALVLDA